MNSELQALLQVQDADNDIRSIEARRDALTPRLTVLDTVRKRVLDEATRSDATLTRELDRLHALEGRITEHRERHEKNVAILNQAHKLKEATAAMAQVETARRVLADEESELLALTRRIADLRTAATAARGAADSLDEEQRLEREAVATERSGIERELKRAMNARATKTAGIDTALLSRYDRVSRNRRTSVLFPLSQGFACGNCDTAIPYQRRPAMSSGSTIETCEGCGMLLYAAAPAAVAS